MKYYAIHKGREIGIFKTWNECNELIQGFKGAKFKKFDNLQDAQNFVENGYIKNNEIYIKDKIDLENDVIYVYTDGACINNGTPSASAGIGIFFGDNDSRNVSTKVNGKKQTNNVAELKAIKMVYKILKNEINDNKQIRIYSDSKYAINCCTDYGKKNHDSGWINNIPNRSLVKKTYELYMNLNNIKFIHIKAHTNNTDVHSYGNSQADYLANNAALNI